MWTVRSMESKAWAKEIGHKSSSKEIMTIRQDWIYCFLLTLHLQSLPHNLPHWDFSCVFIIHKTLP